MTLTEAYEKLNNARDLNGIMPNDAVDVILGATCGTCGRAESLIPVRPTTRWCDMLEKRVTADHGCRAWQKREEQV